MVIGRMRLLINTEELTNELKNLLDIIDVEIDDGICDVNGAFRKSKNDEEREEIVRVIKEDIKKMSKKSCHSKIANIVCSIWLEKAKETLEIYDEPDETNIFTH